MKNDQSSFVPEESYDLGTRFFQALAVLVVLWIILNYAPNVRVTYEGSESRYYEPVEMGLETPIRTEVASPVSAPAPVEYSVPDREIEVPKELNTEVVRGQVGTNDLAPADVSEISSYNARNYLARFAPLAQAEMRKFDIPASITLAQGLVESRAGTSKLAVKNSNHFGIKCKSKKCKKGHCTNFTDDSHKDFFLKFSNVWTSYRAHSVLLMGDRYKGLLACGNDITCWAVGLERAGYATDRDYAEKLIATIKRYQLQKYDRP